MFCRLRPVVSESTHLPCSSQRGPLTGPALKGCTCVRRSSTGGGGGRSRMAPRRLLGEVLSSNAFLRGAGGAAFLLYDVQTWRPIHMLAWTALILLGESKHSYSHGMHQKRVMTCPVLLLPSCRPGDSRRPRLPFWLRTTSPGHCRSRKAPRPSRVAGPGLHHLQQARNIRLHLPPPAFCLVLGEPQRDRLVHGGAERCQHGSRAGRAFCRL